MSSSWRQALRDPRPANFSQLNTCGYSPYVTSSLMREWVCSLQLLLASSAQSFSGLTPAEIITTFYCLKFKTPPEPGRPGTRIYIPQEQGDSVIPPGTGFPFRLLLWLAGLRWRYSTVPPQGSALKSSFLRHLRRVLSSRIPRRVVRWKSARVSSDSSVVF
jgi:hypothetical protein